MFNKLLVNLTNCKIPECPMFPASILKEWKIEVNTKCEPQGQFSTISPDLVNEKTALNYDLMSLILKFYL